MLPLNQRAHGRQRKWSCGEKTIGWPKAATAAEAEAKPREASSGRVREWMSCGWGQLYVAAMADRGTRLLQPAEQ